MMYEELSTQTDVQIPFEFFVSLLQAIASIKPKPVYQTSDTNYKDLALRKLNNWRAELHRHYSPLPPGTTAVFFRLFFPELDVARRYGIQEKKLYDYLGELFSPKDTTCVWARVLQATSVEDVGCFGSQVQKAFEAVPVHEDSSISMVEVDALLTELASNCGFSAPSVRHITNRRSPRDILKILYTRMSPSAAGFLTQIILKDLRPILYPISETHYTTCLLQYNSKAVSMLTKEDVMKAWDPSGRMLRMYRVRASLEDAATACDDPSEVTEPQIGVPIQIPKCLKGHSCKNAISLLRDSKKVWVETKYDGERAQIHVQLEECGSSYITIFSKSRRDSTLDRYAVHSIIRQALGLFDQDTTANPQKSTSRIKLNVILEAEMVAFSDPLNRVDEFWRIRSLIASTAKGVRNRPLSLKRRQDESELDISQCSLLSDASDNSTRHLALVFFDILYLDSQSLLHHSYSDRRSLLERLLIYRPGFSMLAERISVDMHEQDVAVKQLECAFAKLLADHQEGAVLKAEESRYCDWGLQWVKLKADYIPGYGDCVDLALIGAVWDKDRGAELRVPSSVYTTFYFGALTNAADLEANPDAKAHFSGIFISSYGLSREKLEELNFIIRSSDPVSCHPNLKRPMPEMSYTYDMPPGLTRPSVLLQTPILAELFGAGFTKAPRCTFYELRFPRISKIFRFNERSWRDGCMALCTLQAIAREAIGKDRPHKDVEDWCNVVWGKPVTPGVDATPKRKRRQEVWMERLTNADGRERKTRRINLCANTGVTGEDKCGREVDDENLDVRKQEASKLGQNTKLRVFGSVTNVLAGSHRPLAGPVPATSILTPSHASADNSYAPLLLLKEAAGLPYSPLGEQLREEILQQHTSLTLVDQDLPTAIARTTTPIKQSKSTNNSSFSPTLSHLPSTALLRCRYADTPLGQFLDTAVVWLLRRPGSPRPSWRIPSSHVIPPSHQVHSFEAFIMACGWSQPAVSQSSNIKFDGKDGTGIAACGWAERGVLFVDEADLTWVDGTLRRLIERRASFMRQLEDGAMSAPCKPVWVLSMACLKLEEVSRQGDIESRALCRFG